MLSSLSHAYLLLFNTQAVITHHFRDAKKNKKKYLCASVCVFKAHFRMCMLVCLIAFKGHSGYSALSEIRIEISVLFIPGINLLKQQ